MGSIVVQTFLTLDGVAQAPGASDEDREGGFPHGGWQLGFDDQETVPEWEKRSTALLLGRRTYEIFANAWGVWPEDAPGFQGELTRLYNRIPKYVASNTLTEVGWQNSYLLGPDVPGAVRRLREETEGEIRVWGSTSLIRTLAEHDLIDEYRLMVFPLVLGTGKKLFGDGFPVSRLTLIESHTVPAGIVISTYRRTEAS
ncbi:dihydrofolate reductase family protein [Leifsonia sp. NPDC080035]|uniref:Dihydrofolate reductase family protein n=1 Tax=Leifsonia sp. NPDC080035 TaxID=3143936 RepID=A0AAU7GCQ2_9MICO